MAAEFILHHYDTSPFSEKPRVMFGVKGLAWRSVIEPVIMPKPELTALTGGYRRIPVLQIGADIYCDTQVALAEIEARAPRPRVAHGADWAVNSWADRAFFQTTVAVVFGAIGDNVPAEFIADREKLSGRAFDMAAMKAAAGPMQAQWRVYAAWIEEGLLESEFLGGAAPSLADVAAYMNVWWLSAAARAVADELLAGFPRVAAWRSRMAAIGHGGRQEMTRAEALEIARDSEPAAPPPHEAGDLQPGDAVTVQTDDYGRDPIAGRLVSLTSRRIVISRETEELGLLHVHFPRFGYVIARGG